MRNAFVNELFVLAENDPRIVILSADIGNRMFDKFAAAFPRRFINVGIAEANMTGMAAGLAMAGLRPFTYTIAAFNPGRCAEQIRLDICQHNLPVVAVGVGAGLSYASLGPTHHALEDIAWMRSIPNMTVVCPGDPVETRLAVRAAVMHDGPVYLRLGKKGETIVHTKEPGFHIGRVIKIRDGKDVAILAVGTVLPIAVETGTQLCKTGIDAAIYSFHTIKPLDSDFLHAIFSGGVKAVVIIEEHVAAGGAWSAVAEWVVEYGPTPVPLLRIGCNDAFIHRAGNQDEIRKYMKLHPEYIAEKIRDTVRSPKKTFSK